MPNASPLRRRTIPLWLKVLLLAGGYVVAAEIGNLLSIQRAFSTFWPPAGLFVAVLLISERRDWPALIAAGMVGNLCSDLLHGRALLVTVGFSTANALEALAAALLVSWLVGARPRLDSLRQALSFAAVGAVMAPMVGATVGTLVVSATAPGAASWTTWYTWWIGDVLGIVVVGSLILTAVGQWDRYRERPAMGARRVLRPLVRSLLIAVPFSVLAFFVFAPLGGGTSWKFLVTPGLVTCALVGGPFGAAVGLALISLGGISGMVFGAPVTATLAAPMDALRVLQAQAFFAVGGITSLALAGVIAQSVAHADDARASTRRFRLLFDTMREGVTYCHVIRDHDGHVVDWVYLQVNEAYGKLTGFGDVAGRHVSEFLPNLRESNPELFEVYGEVAATGGHAVVEALIPEIGRLLRISVTSPARGDFLTVMEDVTERAAEEQALAESNQRLEKMAYDVAAAMGSMVEARDAYTQGHQLRVAALARRIAQEMGLPDDGLDEISMAGLLHDIGKLRVPAEILTKPGVLSALEMSLIREHPAQAYEILRHIDFPWPVADIVLQHHERLDGSGYPSGLRGEEIMLAARILGVADVVEAMASHRPYRPAVGLSQAIQEVATRPDRYDAKAAKACVRLYKRGEIGL
jgi:putative nucleotidyltransferase with HDIG domain